MEQSPNCTQEGILLKRCGRCNQTFRETAQRLPHQLSSYIILNPDDCHGPHIMVYTCNNCDYSRQEDPGPMRHQFVASYREDRDCMVDAVLYSCQRCKQQDERWPGAHRYGNWEWTQPASCTLAGKMVRHCTLCPEKDQQETSPLPHAYHSPETIRLPSCLDGGLFRKACMDCGHTVDFSLGKTAHVYDPYETTLEPSCLEEGIESKRCSLCNAVEERPLPALGHALIEHLLPPSCLEAGLLKLECQICPYLEERPLPATMHRFGAWSLHTPATCTAPGEERSTCTACGQIQSRSTQQLPHAFLTWVVQLPSTCSQPGVRSSTCLRCNQPHQESLPLAEHSFGAWKDAFGEDCQLSQQQSRSCEHCHLLEMRSLPGRTHRYEPWQVTRASTCHVEGQRERRCRYCPHIEQEALALRKHVAGRWVITTRATLLGKGEQQKHCKYCGEFMQSRFFTRAKRAFAVNFCVAGPQFSKLWPGLSKEWYRFNVIDLQQQGEQRFDLLAANRFLVGEVVALIQGAELTLRYSFFGRHTEALRSRLQIILPGQTLDDYLIHSNRLGYPFNEAISIPKRLGGATSALLYVRLQGVFNQDDPLNKRLRMEDEDVQALWLLDEVDQDFAMSFQALLPGQGK